QMRIFLNTGIALLTGCSVNRYGKRNCKECYEVAIKLTSDFDSLYKNQMNIRKWLFTKCEYDLTDLFCTLTTSSPTGVGMTIRTSADGGIKDISCSLAPVY